MLALYWSAGIVAMLTAGGILTAMIARGDADRLMDSRSAPAAPSIVIVQTPIPAATAAQTQPIPAIEPATAAVPAPVVGRKMTSPATVTANANANANAAATGVSGTKPGQIVDLQLWKARPPKEGASGPASGGAAAAPAAPASAITTTSQKGLATPDNDPAVRLARDQLESTLK